MGGRSSKPRGPSNAFLGADGRPYYEPDPDEERTRCCCVYVARGFIRTLLFLSLVCIIGLGAAALIAGPRKYWTYFVNKTPSANANPAANTVNFYRIRTGFLRCEQQAVSSSGAIVQRSLKDVSKGLWIMGIVAAAVTGVSCLAALWKTVSTLFGQVTRLGGVCCFLPLGVAQIGVAVAYYVLAAVYISRLIGQSINRNSVPWPDWAWFFVAGQGVLWLLCAFLALIMPRATKYVPNQYLQTEAGRARGWDLAQHAPQQESEATRLPGNQPSSAPINDAPLEYHAKAPRPAGGSGWFGGGSRGRENYSDQAAEIAERYRGRGGGVELPTAYPRV